MQLLWNYEDSLAWNVGGVKDVRKRLNRIVMVNEIQFGLVPGRGTIDAVFILRRLQVEYYA